MKKRISTLFITMIIALAFGTTCMAAQSPETKKPIHETTKKKPTHETTKKKRNNGNSGRKGDKENYPNGRGGQEGENDNGPRGNGGNGNADSGMSDNSSTSPKTGYAYEAGGLLVALITGTGVMLVSRKKLKEEE